MIPFFIFGLFANFAKIEFDFNTFAKNCRGMFSSAAHSIICKTFHNNIKTNMTVGNIYDGKIHIQSLDFTTIEFNFH